MRPVRIALALAAGLVVCLAGAIAFVAWALATEPGTAWLVARVQARMPGLAAVDRVGGTLWRGLRLYDVAIDTPAAEIEIDEATLRLELAELIRGALIVDELAIGTMTYRRIERSSARADDGFSLPLRIVVRDGSLERLVMPGGQEQRIVGPITVRADAVGDRVVADRFAGSGMGFDVSGSGELRFGAGIALDVDLEWATERGGFAYAGSGSASGVWPRLAFEQQVRSPVALEAKGELELGAAPSATLDASWTGLSWPSLPGARSPAGVARLTGWLDDYEFAVDGTLSVEGIDSAVTANGRGDRAALQFAALDLSGEHGSVAASGRLVFDPVSWMLDVRTEGLDPAARFPDWPGSLALAGRLSGSAEPVLELALAEMTASGELRGQPVAAEGGIAYRAPNRWRFDALTVRLAGNEVGVDGSAGDMLSLDVAVDAPALERILPEAAGAIRGAGHVAGTLEDPQLSGSLEGTGLRYRDYAAESVVVAGDIVADDARTVALSLAAESVTWRERSLSAVTAGISGTAAAHTAELDVVADDGNARFRAQGAWSAGSWSGRVTALAVEQPSVGEWRLVEPVEVTASRDRLIVDLACLAQAQARLCATTRIGTGDDLLQVDLTAFDLGALSAVLPEGYSMAGRYDGHVSLRGPLSRPVGDFQTRGVGTVLTIREADQPTPLEIPIDLLEITGALSPGGALRLTAALEGGAGAQVDIHAAVPDLWAEQPEIDAEVSGRWAELGILSLASPDIGDVRGTANINLMLDGPLRSPSIHGDAHWVDGEVAVPRWGLLVEDIDADITSSDGTELLLQASALAGEGRLEINGRTQVDPDAGWPTELRVFGDRLQAVRLADAEILVSPALEMRAALPSIEVDGAFLIPSARIRLDELPPQAVEPSPDTVVHGVDRPEQLRPLDVHANLRVGLGDDVRYSGAGLDVALSGAMGLVYESGRDAVASGAVTLTGEYQAYGQTLQIDEGQLVFNGSVANPTLDVRAVRHVEARTVGVQLSGTVEDPVSRIFSEPATNEADALSYLLLGRPLSASGDEETATLESAALSMGLQQALPVFQRVGETLGLDELSVQTTAADAGELMAGKRISPRVYLRYTYGLVNRIGGLLMRFNLSQRFSLETFSGDEGSMDLLYTVERD